MKFILIAGAIGLAALSLSGCVDEGPAYYGSYDRPSYGGYYGGGYYYGRPYGYDHYRGPPRYRGPRDDGHDRPGSDRPHPGPDHSWHHGGNDRPHPPGQPHGPGGDRQPSRHFDGHDRRVIIQNNN